MRLLVINPNTTEAVTRAVAALARMRLPGIEVVEATGRFGARYVSSRAAFAIAGHAALDAYAEHGRDCDAVLLACFGDPGLDGLKELAEVPVTALAEASIHMACLAGGRFGIVTGGERWKAMMTEFVTGQGLGSRLAGVRTVAPTGGEIAANPKAALALLAETCRAAVREDGADVVILGGAGLVGLAEQIAPEVPVPVICSVEAGIAAIGALMKLGPAKAKTGAYARTPGVESVGLGGNLAELLAKPD